MRPLIPKCLFEQNCIKRAKEIPSYDENIPVFTAETGDIWHSALVPSDADRSNQEISKNDSISKNSVSNETFFFPKKTQTLLNLLTESQDEIITVKNPELKEDKPSSRNKQYLDVAQGTSEWRAARVRVIPVSKLPSLLGFNGNKESDSSWVCAYIIK